MWQVLRQFQIVGREGVSGGVLSLLRGAERRSNPFFSFVAGMPNGLLRFARNDVEGLFRIFSVMPGLVPGVHVLSALTRAKTWMGGARAARSAGGGSGAG